uniref:Uncharacterized protein n=1 Tax=Glossina austeni TaxID=7395 RepID=A0A1A9UQM4_GLOAU
MIRYAFSAVYKNSIGCSSSMPYSCQTMVSSRNAIIFDCYYYTSWWVRWLVFGWLKGWFVGWLVVFWFSLLWRNLLRLAFAPVAKQCYSGKTNFVVVIVAAVIFAKHQVLTVFSSSLQILFAADAVVVAAVDPYSYSCRDNSWRPLYIVLRMIDLWPPFDFKLIYLHLTINCNTFLKLNQLPNVELGEDCGGGGGGAGKNYY